MKEKLKKVNFANVATIIKASLIGVIVSILLVLLFAFVLKFLELSGGIIGIVDQIIKILSIFIAVISLNKMTDKGLLTKGLVCGAVYSILTFAVFSALNGGMVLGAGFISDIIFSALVGGVSAIFINLIKKK